MHRALYRIAREIKNDWVKMSYSAKPYVEAMFEGDQITDKYIVGDFHSVVLGFICNASTWRGETAKRIKAELKEIAHTE
jgi:hypothetical protein